MKQKLVDFKTNIVVNEDGINEIVNVLKLWEFDQELYRKKLAIMLIENEFPFVLVEHEGFREFCKL